MKAVWGFWLLHRCLSTIQMGDDANAALFPNLVIAFMLTTTICVHLRDLTSSYYRNVVLYDLESK